jgi:hypothetical protein
MRQPLIPSHSFLNIIQNDNFVNEKSPVIKNRASKFLLPGNF